MKFLSLFAGAIAVTTVNAGSINQKSSCVSKGGSCSGCQSTGATISGFTNSMNGVSGDFPGFSSWFGGSLLGHKNKFGGFLDNCFGNAGNWVNGIDPSCIPAGGHFDICFALINLFCTKLLLIIKPLIAWCLALKVCGLGALIALKIKIICAVFAILCEKLTLILHAAGDLSGQCDKFGSLSNSVSSFSSVLGEACGKFGVDPSSYNWSIGTCSNFCN